VWSAPRGQLGCQRRCLGGWCCRLACKACRCLGMRAGRCLGSSVPLGSCREACWIIHSLGACSPVAGLDQQAHVGIHEGRGHAHVRPAGGAAGQAHQLLVASHRIPGAPSTCRISTCPASAHPPHQHMPRIVWLPQPGGLAGRGLPVGEYKVGVVAQLLDEAENVVPAPTVQACRRVGGAVAGHEVRRLPPAALPAISRHPPPPGCPA